MMVIAGYWKWPPWTKGKSTDDDSLEELGLEVWQELEKNPVIRERLRRACMAEGDVDDDVRDSIDQGGDPAKAL